MKQALKLPTIIAAIAVISVLLAVVGSRQSDDIFDPTPGITINGEFGDEIAGDSIEGPNFFRRKDGVISITKTSADFAVGGASLSDALLFADVSDTLVKINGNFTVTGTCTGCGAGGAPTVLDLADDESNESADVTEIATTGDTNSIFTEPSADKLLIAVGSNWPTADTANAGDSATAFFSSGTIEHERGGLELDISAIGIGDIIAGLSAGTVEVVDGGSASDGDLLTIQADGTVEWETPSAGGDITAVGSCASGACFGDGSNHTLVFEGSTVDTVETTFGATDPTVGDQTINLPDFGASGTYILAGDTVAVTNLDGTGLSIAAGVLSADLGTSIDISSETNLTCGTNCTLTGDEISVDDSFLLNSGDIGTGVYDFGGATSIEIVNGTGPTVDAAGEIAVDTTDDQLVYYGGAKRVLSYKRDKSITLETPADADNFNIWKAPDGLTITDIHCIVDPADTGESVVIDVQERNSTADSPATVDATITCDNDGAEDDGTLSNGTIDAGDWVSLDIGTVTGTVTQVTVSIYYTLDAE